MKKEEKSRSAEGGKEEEGVSLCPECGSQMIEEDGEIICPNCDQKIDFFGEEDK